MSVLPGAVEVDLDDDVGLLGLAFDLREAVCHGAPELLTVASSVAASRALACQQRVVLGGQPGGGPQVSGDADVADQDPGVEVALPGGRRVGELAEQHEVGVAGNDPETHAGQGFRHPLALGDQRRHAAQGVVGVPQGGAGGGLGEHRQVVRQPHQQHRVDDRGSGDQVAESPAGEGERLAHGAADDQLGRVVVDQRDRAGLRGEFAVGLVDDQDAAGHPVQQAAQVVERNTLSRRVVRARDEHDVGPVRSRWRRRPHRCRDRSRRRGRPRSTVVWVPSEMIGCIE